MQLKKKKKNQLKTTKSDIYITFTFTLYIVHGKNDFAEVFKNLAGCKSEYNFVEP